MDAKKDTAKPAYKSPKKKTRELLQSEPRLDMTPMIDCVFQLLIFFMLTGKFVSTEGKLSAYLPKDRGRVDIEVPPPKRMPARVLLRWNPTIGRCKVYVGQILCNYDEEGLQRALKKVREVKQTGVEEAEIDASGDVPMTWVVQTLNMLIVAGMPAIHFTGSMSPLEDHR